MDSACCETSIDSVHAQGAAEWVRAFYPDLQVEVEQGRVLIRSDQRSKTELSLIWKVALANEKLQRQGRSHREGVLAELLA
jgi:hypothetical protein